jgi:hypothetical protein
MFIYKTAEESAMIAEEERIAAEEAAISEGTE